MYCTLIAKYFFNSLVSASKAAGTVTYSFMRSSRRWGVLRRRKSIKKGQAEALSSSYLGGRAWKKLRWL